MKDSDFPHRPDHRDFWLLASVVQDYDSVMDNAVGEEEKQRRHEGIVKNLIDGESLTYMAMQRAMRMVGAATRNEVRYHATEITKLTSIYYEAVLVGIEIERRRVGRADKMPGFVPFAQPEPDPEKD